MPNGISDKLKFINSVDDSSSSSSSSGSDTEQEIPFMPATRPSFGPIGACSLISKVRMFLPIIAATPLPETSCDPELVEPSVAIHDELEPEYGVEMNVSLGVYDVAGKVDEKSLSQQGIPIIAAPPTPDLIQEI